MKIVITGSLGHISKPLAESLLQQGYTAVVISSDDKKASAIEALGATAAIGSVEDVPFLVNTFTGADAVYCMTPPNFKDPDQIAYYVRIAEAYAAAIQQAGVKKAIYLSSYGAHLPSGTGFITGSHKAENIFNAIPDLAVTHMRPTFFYYNLLGFIPMIKKAGMIAAVYGGEDKLAMVSPKDIADAIAEEITTDNNGIHIRYVTSDDRTCTEVAKVLGTAIGKPDLTWKAVPPEAALQGMLANGMPQNAAETLLELGTAIHTGALREDYDKHRPVFGKVTLEAFAKEFADAYNQNAQPAH
jgi:uncharacterized protein YbjT (DUF2867 family)